MTVAAGWIRRVNNCEELLFVSDSRLCGGHRWDECPKIFPMQRSDCAICFAGDTAYSYPVMMQLYYALGEMIRVRSRAMDITDVNGYVLKYINRLVTSIYDAVDPMDIKDNMFLFGGYSWVDKRFKLWRYYFDKRNKCFAKDGKVHKFDRAFGNISVIGDKAELFKQELRRILHEKYGQNYENYQHHGFDMEPFEALRNILRSAKPEDTIGGAPQIIKIYQHMNTRPIGVYWPRKCEDVFQNRTLMGRRMFDFEDTEYWFMDPDTFCTSQCTKN